MDEPRSFTYWRRPWHKWPVLALAGLECWSLWTKVREYRYLSGAGIFSAAQWERYAAQAWMQCALAGMLAALFLGVFLIGCLARSRRPARLAEGALLLACALVWGGGLVLLRPALRGMDRFLWGAVLLLALFGGIHSLWAGRREL